MTKRRSLLVTWMLAAACAPACSSSSSSSSPSTPAAPSAPAAPLPLASLPDIDTEAALGHIKRLAADELGGRLPGSKGEELTVQYLVEQFKAVGAQPGNPD